MGDLISMSSALNVMITNKETKRLIDTETDNTKER